MKTKLITLLGVLLCYALQAQIINFPDANFKQALLEHDPVIDTDNDGEISVTEAENTIEIRIKNLAPVIVISDTSGLEAFVNLKYLQMTKIGLTSIDLSSNTNIEELRLFNNNLTSIDLSNNTKVKLVNLYLNKLTSVDFSNNPLLENLFLQYNKLTSINVSQNPFLKNIDLLRNELVSINVSNNSLLTKINIQSNDLQSIDLLNNTALTTLNLSSNDLVSLDVSNNVTLKELDLQFNDLTSIDLVQNNELQRLYLNSNKINTIDLSKNKKLLKIDLNLNDLDVIDFSENILLEHISIASNNLNDIDVSLNTKLKFLSVVNNNITQLDVSNCILNELYFSANENLKKVFMPEQLNSQSLKLWLNLCPNLEFICANQDLLAPIFSLLKQANQTDVLLSSDCTTPSNRISGKVTYDNESDGCDDQDVAFTEDVSFSLFSPFAGRFTVFPDEQGEYSFFVPDANNYLMTANLSRNYFTFFPEIVFDPVTSFFNVPDDLDTITTDYCVRPAGSFNDVEISIIPINRARPGFIANYILVYKNIGTTTQSGVVTLDYPEDVSTYTSSTPSIVSNNNGSITWGFNNLAPLEEREIVLSLTLNAPTANPALNDGDILNFVSNITINTSDLNEENNIAILNQDVVNTFDPNDKTCLEGNSLDVLDIGNYLHYLIRFENTGSAEAVNIRVEDDIDTSKFDMTTFEPLDGSHLFTTTVSESGKIEFHFSNINLPFDDANNDGYVLFKIKTKNNLSEGDEIINKASIYFDFNFPIVTEDEVVTVETDDEEPEFSDFFTLSPNPTSGIFNVEILDSTMHINYSMLYDINGNLVGFFFYDQTTMDISYLFPNTYFLKIITNKGEFNTTVIKL